MKVNRRQFVRGAACCTVGAAAGVGFYSWQIEPHWLEVIERDMPLRGLPKSLEGKRLVQLSDLHVSEFVERDYLRSAIAQTVDLKPDIVLVTGDLMTSRELEQVTPLVEILTGLDPDSRAVFAIPGNHDYGWYCHHPHQADALQQALTRRGIGMLRNNVVDYQGLQIVGFDEVMAGRFNPTTTLATFDNTRDGIAMTHNPDTVDYGGWAGFGGWVLAGHTHGGQCRLPYFGAPIIPIDNRRYVSGHIDIGDGRQLYVNRGLGYTRRLRLLCRPEITLFRLTAKSSLA